MTDRYYVVNSCRNCPHGKYCRIRSNKEIPEECKLPKFNGLSQDLWVKIDELIAKFESEYKQPACDARYNTLVWVREQRDNVS